MRSTASSLSLLGSVVCAQKLGLTVDTTDGTFAITHDGHAWLTGGEVMVGGLAASAGELKLASTGTSAGTDALGAYAATTLRWADAKDAAAAVMMETSFRTYAADASAIVFEQSFPGGLGADPAPHAHRRAESTNMCRVVTQANVALTKSIDKYDAWTPAPANTTATTTTYVEHKGDYCDAGHKWAYTADVDQAACQAKCAQLDCTCFDFTGSAPPAPAPKSLAARTVFPGFTRGTAATAASDALDAFGYHGVFPALKATTVGAYRESHQGGAPLAIYDSKNASLPATVFSPLALPKAHHMASSKSFFGAGVKATATAIPAGHSQTFLLVAGVGVTKTFQAWGDRMLASAGKARVDNRYKDTTHGTIGFWTDNGGYYHYATGTDKNRTYEEVLPEVKAYHDELGVPFGHWQFDSWFYPKDGGVNPGGGGGAVTNWTAMTGPNSGGTVVFPSGMANIQKLLSANTTVGGQLTPGVMPTVMHNRQWSTHSDYIANWTDIPWYISGKAAIPHDPAKFFARFFTQQQGWGLTMYEQDWMCTEYDEVEALQTNLTLADEWLAGMNSGAAGSGRSIQYCMPYPNDVLAASAHAAVTNARATGDYFHCPHQWAVGGTSLFYHALNILPFKDGFYSSNNKQVGGQTVGPETDPDRETLMATLSCAMVGPMDGINLLNKTRIMATCTADGTVLKPDEPVKTSDWCMSKADPGCFVYVAHSTVECEYVDCEYVEFTTHYHYNDLNTYKTLEAGMVGLHDAAAISAHAVYNWYSGELAMMQASQTLTPGYEGHAYAVVTPVLASTWVFLGETDKYVTQATKRFVGVTATASALTATLAGKAGETVTVCAARAADLKIMCKQATVAATKQATVTFN